MENKYLSEFDFSCYLSGVGNKAKDGGNEAIGKYLEYQKKGETFTMYFELANEEGDLITHDKGCRIVLPNTEINGREYDPYNRARKLTRKYKVQVIAVDKEKVEVTVSHNEVRKADNVRVVSLLNKSLEKDEHCVVPAKVIVVYNNVVILDIGGLGIPGYMPIKEWSMAYTNDLRVVTQKNEIVYVAVMSRGEMNENSQKRYFRWTDIQPYMCSRRTVNSEDPWNGIEKSIPEKSIVRVRCAERKEHNFYGTIQAYPEISVYCFYPEGNSNLSKKDIVPGCLYEGYVSKINEEKRILRVRVFKSIKEE